MSSALFLLTHRELLHFRMKLSFPRLVSQLLSTFSPCRGLDALFSVNIKYNVYTAYTVSFKESKQLESELNSVVFSKRGRFSG